MISACLLLAKMIGLHGIFDRISGLKIIKMSRVVFSVFMLIVMFVV